MTTEGTGAGGGGEAYELRILFPLFKSSLVKHIVFYKLLTINRTPKDAALSRLSS